MRPIMGCVDFMIKTVFVSFMRSRTEKTHTIEGCGRVIAYDIDHILRPGFRKWEFSI